MAESQSLHPMLWEEQYKKELAELADEILAGMLAAGHTMHEIARGADMAPTTVWRLVEGQTVHPRFSTVWKLAKLAGFRLSITPRKKLRLKKAS